jgi:hypothetical protein
MQAYPGGKSFFGSLDTGQAVELVGMII